MREIVLPDLQFTIQDHTGEVRKIGTAEQLYLLVSIAPDAQHPFSLDEIRQGLPLVAKLDELRKNGGNTLELEDAQWDLLSLTIQRSTWTARSEDVVTLADAVLQAKVVQVKA